MDPALFIKSFILGLAIAAPLGPIGALCINRTLERGFWAGMVGGLGTALADALYATLAALGFAAFAALLSHVDGPMRLVGGMFMIWLGWRSMRPKPAPKAARIGAGDLLGTLLATFMLTLTSPLTIVSFTAIFAGLGLANDARDGGAVMVVAGIFLGSLCWWALLSGGVALAHKRLPAGFAGWVARLSGLVLIGFGVLAISSLAWMG